MQALDLGNNPGMFSHGVIHSTITDPQGRV